MTIYEVVANRVIERLTRTEEKGEKFNWVKPFDITEGKRFPCNYGALIPYTGINRILAEPDEYLTFNQIKELNNKNKMC